MPRRGRPRKVAITLSGHERIASAPRRIAPKTTSRSDILELFHSQGLMPWFDVAAARVYQRVMTSVEPSARDSTVGKVAARVRFGWPSASLISLMRAYAIFLASFLQCGQRFGQPCSSP